MWKTDADAMRGLGFTNNISEDIIGSACKVMQRQHKGQIEAGDGLSVAGRYGPGVRRTFLRHWRSHRRRPLGLGLASHVCLSSSDINPQVTHIDMLRIWGWGMGTSWSLD
jgi:hypothetical protein